MSDLHRIVIVGGGAGGLCLAAKLGKTLTKKGKACVTLVDKNLTHIWKPLLHEVAAGTLNSNEDELNYLGVAKKRHFTFEFGEFIGLDRRQKTITLDALRDSAGSTIVPKRDIHYDTLVIAIGSTTNDFGVPGAKEHCYLLNSREEAELFHKHYLELLMATKNNPTYLGRPINIVIVGAGATGVELAAELHNAQQQIAEYDRKKIEQPLLNISLIESSERILPALVERIALPVRAELDRLKVAVCTNERVTDITANHVATASGKTFAADLMIWTAGVIAPSFLSQLDGLETNKMNQLVVKPTLQTTVDDNIFAIGDCANCLLPGCERPVPPRAQSAHQQAVLLCQSLPNLLEGKALSNYEYHDAGSLVSMGGETAVGRLMGNVTGNKMLEGRVARWVYLGLYKKHQVSIFGYYRIILLTIANFLTRRVKPRLKLH